MPAYELIGFDPVPVTGLFHPRNRRVVLGSTPTLLAVNDPTRIIITFYVAIGVVGGSVGVFWGQGPGTNRYMPVDQNSHLTFKYADYGALVGYDWYGFTLIPGTPLEIWEVSYRVNSALPSLGSVVPERQDNRVSQGQQAQAYTARLLRGDGNAPRGSSRKRRWHP